MHNKVPPIFSGPLGDLKEEGGVGFALGPRTKGKGESSDGGSGKERGCLLVRAPHLLSWRGWGWFPVCPLPHPYPAFSTPQLTTGVVSVVSRCGRVDTVFVLGKVV